LFDLRRSVPLLLSWIGLLVASLLVPVSEALPFRLGFVRPDNLFVAFTEAQVGFVVLLWPLFLGNEAPAAAFVRLGALVVLASPLLLVAANVSDAGAGTLIRTQLLVAALGGFAVALGATLGSGAAPGYYLGAFVLSALVPFAAFLSHEFGGPDLSGLSLVSPFWAAARPSFGPAALFGGLAVALLAARRLLSRGMDAGSPAG
jgi:hypothetical protein